ncbi:hypothetical protein F5J12DRAFT_779765 [Pisolithus orientalis]|uniref:uncharacterized protein n=1 Tax=Pisolithus orientalis TaxID=936130 RepID=UPI002223F805|nr:uncharacterized protein F5J12DRAFT_779765 [Pisolithus orientalis]KAI6030670.1 hypothetical protein F5J12DRAFT_779765 [Pisolithus orientalis]
MHTLCTREDLDFDVFLFPDNATNDNEGTPHPATIKSYRTRVPGGPSSESEMIQNVKGTVESTLRHSIMVPEHQEHKIHNLNVIISCFISSGNAPLKCPPVHSQAVHGDLYIHHYENQVQIVEISVGYLSSEQTTEGILVENTTSIYPFCAYIWLRDSDQWLPDIKDRCHHPTLPEYHLYVAKGMEPTWVTRKTRSTYKERLKNHIQQQEDGKYMHELLFKHLF